MADDTIPIARIAAATAIPSDKAARRLLAWHNALGRTLTEQESADCLAGKPLVLPPVIDVDCKFTIDVAMDDAARDFLPDVEINLTGCDLASTVPPASPPSAAPAAPPRHP